MFAAVERRSIPQPYTGIVVFEVRYGTDTTPIAVDYYDYKPINGECLEQVPLYLRCSTNAQDMTIPESSPAGISPVSRPSTTTTIDYEI